VAQRGTQLDINRDALGNAVMSRFTRNRSFRLLFSATAVSNLGDGIAALAFPWLATLITRDPALIAFVGFATRLPWFLFAIPAGVITDRRDRRRLMVQADGVRVLVTLAVIALVSGGGAESSVNQPLLAISALSALAFLLGCAEVVRDNAAQTVLPSIIDKTGLERANGQMWTIEQIMGSFIGPPLAGILIAWALPAPFVVIALGFALAAWLVCQIHVPVRQPAKRRHPLVEIREGWHWMRAHPTILRLAIMLGLMNALAMMAITILVLVSQDILDLSAAGHGVLLTAGAAGGVAGGVFGPRIVAALGPMGSVRLALVLFPIPFALIALSSNAWIVAVALFVEMAAGLIWNITTVSYRQRRIPDALLGRVNSLYRFFGWGMMPVGALAGGWIVSAAEPGLGHDLALRLPYVVASLGSVALGVYGWARLRLSH